MIYSVNPLSFFRSFWFHRYLVWQMTKREIIGRYRGSLLGLFWSLFNPVLMLSVYTFVFSVVFNARWGNSGEGKAGFALVLFAGLILFNLLAECLNRAPSLIVSQVNYVKKVVFPLEILVVVILGAALFHLLVSFLVWLLFYLIFIGIPPATILLLPLELLPLLLMTLGASWFLASLGVFLRDVSQVIGVVTTVLLFMSPIFYPLQALPERYRPLLYISPLTQIIEASRDLMLWGRGIDWLQWTSVFSLSVIIAWAGLAWFNKTRKGFADVL